MLCLEALNVSNSTVRRLLLGKMPGLGAKSQMDGPGTNSSLVEP